MHNTYITWYHVTIFNILNAAKTENLLRQHLKCTHFFLFVHRSKFNMHTVTEIWAISVSSSISASVDKRQTEKIIFRIKFRSRPSEKRLDWNRLFCFFLYASFLHHFGVDRMRARCRKSSAPEEFCHGHNPSSLTKCQVRAHDNILRDLVDALIYIFMYNMYMYVRFQDRMAFDN